MSNKTFTATVDNYLAQTGWIGESDPVAFGLRQAAAQLDISWTTSLYAEYNKTIRYIESLKPQEVTVKKVDPLLKPKAASLETRES